MSKKQIQLEIGKFYYAYGGGMHPAQIYEIDSQHGTYKSIKTGTTQGKDMIMVKPIQEGLNKSFIHKRPFEGTRADYGNKELLGLEFNPDDSLIIEEIKKRKTKKSRRAKLCYK